MPTDDCTPWSPAEFEQQLRALGRRYHIHHPYHRRMAGGALTPEQIRGWVANRFYYQVKIPQKDGAILANCPDREVRRRWLQRVLDHDGHGDDPGGIEAWLRLGQACGLTREALLSHRHLLPGVRFAVDAYVHFAREAPWQEAIASSLTELFAPSIHRERIAGMLANYDFVNDNVMAYFKRRLTQAPRDSNFTLEFIKEHARTREMQEACVAAVKFKTDMLWAQLDALYLAYVVGMIPPGAYNPGEKSA